MRALLFRLTNDFFHAFPRLSRAIQTLLDRLTEPGQLGRAFLLASKNIDRLAGRICTQVQAGRYENSWSAGLGFDGRRFGQPG